MMHRYDIASETKHYLDNVLSFSGSSYDSFEMFTFFFLFLVCFHFPEVHFVIPGSPREWTVVRFCCNFALSLALHKRCLFGWIWEIMGLPKESWDHMSIMKKTGYKKDRRYQIKCTFRLLKWTPPRMWLKSLLTLWINKPAASTWCPLLGFYFENQPGSLSFLSASPVPGPRCSSSSIK